MSILQLLATHYASFCPSHVHTSDEINMFHTVLQYERNTSQMSRWWWATRETVPTFIIKMCVSQWTMVGAGCTYISSRTKKKNTKKQNKKKV